MKHEVIEMRLLAMLLLMAIAIPAAWTQSRHQATFATPTDAVQALIAALQSGNKQAMLEVLGAKAESAVDSGDPVQDKNARERFLQSYAIAHAFDLSVKDKLILVVGSDNWPLPFPLIKRGERWLFDGDGGSEEIVNRRVGSNELATIQSCLAAVDAEREYYMSNPQNDPLFHYAQKLMSSPGKKDGLYWPTDNGESPSPLGEAFARARGEGYLKNATPRAEPFHGYMYRLLTRQGSHAEGGAYDYLIGDKMLGGFALLAFPAEYGSSGVMTFIVSHDGVVFSKDLGSQTARIAMTTNVFDPDTSWKRETVTD